MASSPTLVKLAQRMSSGLQRELGQGVDVRRMVAQALYARDVLLVCEAMQGTELAALAQQFRAEQQAADADSASAPAPLWPDSQQGPPSSWPKTWFASGWRKGKAGKPDKA